LPFSSTELCLMRRNPAEVCASPKPGRKRRVERQEGHPARKKKPAINHL
jgi:hypothetical protein